MIWATPLMITQAVKTLTSTDPLIRGVARLSLDLTIRKRYGVTEGPEDRWKFLRVEGPVQSEHPDACSGPPTS